MTTSTRYSGRATQSRARPRALGFGFVAMILLASACGDTGDTSLATVNGTEITMSEVLDLRVSYQGDEINTNTEQFRTDLTAVIFVTALVDAAAADLGFVITEADVDQRLADPPERYVGNFATVAGDSNLTDVALRREAAISLLRDGVSAELMRREPGYLDGIIADQPEVVAVACVRHILVATEEEAQEIFDRLGGGEEFAAIADEVSLDTVSSGGLLADGTGCQLPLSRWVPEFGKAAALGPVGEVFGPVETQFGFHVILVEDRTMPTLVELSEDPVEHLSGQEVSAFFTEWFNDEMREADITVNMLVGRWSPDGLGIAPPDA